MSAIRLYNTSATIDSVGVDTEIWQKGTEWGLVERMALNNASHLAAQLTRTEYESLPVGPHGEMYFGCSTNITELPNFWDYVERGKEGAQAHFAVTRYGMDEDEALSLQPNVPKYYLDCGQPSIAQDITALADSIMEVIVDHATEYWDITVKKVTQHPPYAAAWEKIWAERGVPVPTILPEASSSETSISLASDESSEQSSSNSQTDKETGGMSPVIEGISSLFGIVLKSGPVQAFGSYIFALTFTFIVLALIWKGITLLPGLVTENNIGLLIIFLVLAVTVRIIWWFV